MSVFVSFPVLCFLNGKVTVHTEKSFRAMGARFFDEHTFVTLENRRQAANDGWLLDADGRYISLVYNGSLREWARPLSFLWNAVLTKYQARINESVKVGFMLDNLKRIPKSSLGKIGADFKIFLGRYEADQDITGFMLKEWPL